jgi:hypothetical protein
MHIRPGDRAIKMGAYQKGSIPGVLLIMRTIGPIRVCDLHNIGSIPFLGIRSPMESQTSSAKMDCQQIRSWSHVDWMRSHLVGGK